MVYSKIQSDFLEESNVKRLCAEFHKQNELTIFQFCKKTATSAFSTNYSHSKEKSRKATIHKSNMRLCRRMKKLDAKLTDKKDYRSKLSEELPVNETSSNFTPMDLNYQEKSHLEWCQEKSLRLIADYKSSPVLWDPSHPDYRNINIEDDTLNSLSQRNSCDVTELKKKLTDLRSVFQNVHSEVVKKRSESPWSDFTPSWYAYNAMLFLVNYNDTQKEGLQVEETLEELKKIDGDSYANTVKFRETSSSVMNDIEGYVEWSNEKSLKLIEDYRALPILWDTSLPEHGNKNMETALLNGLSTKYSCENNTIKMKIKQLLSSFHREHAKIMQLRRCFTWSVIEPTWYAYHAMLFIAKSSEPLEHRSNDESHGLTEKQPEVDPLSEDSETHETDVTIKDEELDFTEPLTPENSNNCKRRRNSVNGENVKEQYNTGSIQKKMNEESASRNEIDVFGELMAMRLRNIKDNRVRLRVQQQISNLLFEAEMTNYDN